MVECRFKMNVLLSYLANFVFVFKRAKPYSLYVLLVLFLVFTLNQLDRFALQIVQVQSAQALQYGERACMTLGGVGNGTDIDCTKIKNETA